MPPQRRKHPAYMPCTVCGAVFREGRCPEHRRGGKSQVYGGDWERIRLAVLLAYENVCAYCDSDAFTADHVIPPDEFKKSNGRHLRFGLTHPNHLDNLLPACRFCNISKGNKKLEDWAPLRGKKALTVLLQRRKNNLPT